jgi:hypothetical protein
MYSLPEFSKAGSKIGSLERIDHKPAGGNVTLFSEKPKWKKSSRTDHTFKGYKPGGGNKVILDEKINWTKVSRIDSLSNFQTINHLLSKIY